MTTGNVWIDLLIGLGSVLLVKLFGFVSYENAIGAAAGMIAFVLVFCPTTYKK